MLNLIELLLGQLNLLIIHVFFITAFDLKLKGRGASLLVYLKDLCFLIGSQRVNFKVLEGLAQLWIIVVGNSELIRCVVSAFVRDLCQTIINEVFIFVKAFWLVSHRCLIIIYCCGKKLLMLHR